MKISSIFSAYTEENYLINQFEDLFLKKEPLAKLIKKLPDQSEIALNYEDRADFTLKVSEEGIKITEEVSHLADIKLTFMTESVQLLNQYEATDLGDLINVAIKEVISGNIKIELTKEPSVILAKGYFKAFQVVEPYLAKILMSPKTQKALELIEKLKKLRGN